MIKIEKTEIVGWEAAIRGMRNPMNSWDKSDSEFTSDEMFIGDDDLELMQKLSNAGSDHGKFLRMIVIYTDIVAPMYWWKEFDTYKVGTVRNSCSTMHKIHSKEFTLDDFSHEHLDGESINVLSKHIIPNLNEARYIYINGFITNYYTIKQYNKGYWWQMIQMLPSSYNQRSTVMMNYQVLKNMYHSRKNHKLDEWKEFCNWIESLPYSHLITGGKNNDKNS